MKSKFQVAHLHKSIFHIQIKESPYGSSLQSAYIINSRTQPKRESKVKSSNSISKTEMTQMLSILRRNFQNLRKSPRVADETDLQSSSTAGAGPGVVANGRREGFNAVIMRFPFSIISCFAVPRVSGTDGLWMSGDYGSVSEVNHLMVSDGMRYAILM